MIGAVSQINVLFATEETESKAGKERKTYFNSGERHTDT